jgi:hypothetical protein
MDVTVKRSDIELHRNSWKKVAEQHNWYKEPFYVVIWLKDDGRIDDSVSVRDVMTEDCIIPNNDEDTVIIDDDN